MDDTTPARCRRCARRVPWFSFWGNLALALYKLAVGFLGGSAALVADAMHSFADVVGSTGILVATKVSSHDPDATYPYGRGKAEFIGALFVYTILLFFAVGIIVSAVRAIAAGTEQVPHFVTVLGAIVSVFYNALMYRYAKCAGMRNRSPAILADAFENRADAISSAACIVGIAGAMVIHPVCDPIAALVVGIVIAWNAQEQLREAVRGLMDGGMSDAELRVIEREILGIAGVQGIAYVRTRQTGARYWVDAGIYVASDVSVREADAIVDAIRRALSGGAGYHHIEIFVLPCEDSVPHPPVTRVRAIG